MTLIDSFLEHHATILFVIAAISLVVELTIIGLSGPLLFFALGCFATAFLSHFGVISGWESEILSVGVLMALFAAALWKPLKRFQSSGGGPDTSSDMIGQQVPCIQAVTRTSGSIRHSGLNWNARLDPLCPSDGIVEGELCVIAGVEGNVMVVKAVSS